MKKNKIHLKTALPLLSLLIVCFIASCNLIGKEKVKPKTIKPEEGLPIIEKPEIRPEVPKLSRIAGFQVLYFSARTYDELKKEMGLIKETGADTVIVRVFQNNGDRFYPFSKPRCDAGVYFETDSAPVVDDVLGMMIEAARANDLAIYAWMTTRYAVDGKNPFGLYQYDFEKKKIIPAFGVDLFDDKEVDRLVDLYLDLASYDIDGVLFQDDLVLKHNEGFGPGAEKLYRKKIDAEDLYINPYLNGAGTKYYVKEYTDEFWNWSAFKAKRLGEVAGRIIKAAKAERPDLKFCANLSYESVSRPDMALAWLSQDIGEFKRGGVDYFFIMAYHRQMMREKSIGKIDDLAPLMSEICKNALFVAEEPERVVMKLQVLDWDTGLVIPPGELKTIASYLCDADKISIAFVPFRSDAPLGEVRDVLRRNR